MTALNPLGALYLKLEHLDMKRPKCKLLNMEQS